MMTFLNLSLFVLKSRVLAPSLKLAAANFSHASGKVAFLHTEKREELRGGVRAQSKTKALIFELSLLVEDAKWDVVGVQVACEGYAGHAGADDEDHYRR
ncbi:hypothetical protein K4K59_008592 [Colletotrichum sp. SAR11_240]|nr:hypothetical protein K4K59_008592 [Colletotrichum sp. SAR11_240]